MTVKKKSGRRTPITKKIPTAQTVLTDIRRRKFLDVLSKCGNVTESCAAAKVSREAVYAWRNRDEAFAQQWDAALLLGIEGLEDEARRRASNGTAKPVFYKGRVVGHIQEYSDTLMALLLKAHKPEKYRDNVKVDGTLTLEQLVLKSMEKGEQQP